MFYGVCVKASCKSEILGSWYLSLLGILTANVHILMYNVELLKNKK